VILALISACGLGGGRRSALPLGPFLAAAALGGLLLS
jgi:hypothetical protein